MIDVAKISYSLVLLRPDGQKLDLQPVTRSLSWEENDGELAVRLEAEFHNQQLAGGNGCTNSYRLVVRYFFMPIGGVASRKYSVVLFFCLGLPDRPPWGIYNYRL